MLEIEFRGKSVADAIKKGLLYLGCNEEDVEVKVIRKNSNRLFGLMGTRPAIILISVKNFDKMPLSENHKKICEKAEFVLSQILRKMGVQLNKIKSSFETTNIVAVNITTIENSTVIGKNGQTLDALEHITQIVLNKEFDTKYKVILDCENYRKKQKERLKIITDKAVEYVEQTGKIYYFNHMNSKERKIIQLYLKDNPKVKFFYKGNGTLRKVGIICVNKNY
jgi:spoIIIJ-associated protein